MNTFYCAGCDGIYYSNKSNLYCDGIEIKPLIPIENNNFKYDISIDSNEIYISIEHPMTKDNYISFIAYHTDFGYEVKELYPEGNAEARLHFTKKGRIQFFIKNEGLYEIKI